MSEHHSIIFHWNHVPNRNQEVNQRFKSTVTVNRQLRELVTIDICDHYADIISTSCCESSTTTSAKLKASDSVLWKCRVTCCVCTSNCHRSRSRSTVLNLFSLDCAFYHQILILMIWEWYTTKWPISTRDGKVSFRLKAHKRLFI